MTASEVTPEIGDYAGLRLGAPATAPSPIDRYRVVDGCLSRARRDPIGAEIIDRIAEFDARIVEDREYDDGVHKSRVFVIVGRRPGGRVLKPILVRATQFESMNWALQHWGCDGIIYGGCKEQARMAMHALSKPRFRRIYGRTGWVEVDGQWAFLCSGGAVGVSGIDVVLDPPLDRFRLPPVAENLADAVRTSLALLDCGPPSAMIPLLGAVYLAPLSFILRPDAGIWVFGKTGSFKSETAALAQAHFGNFDRKSLPANWSSTDAALQSRLAKLPDVLTVIDDFAPQAHARANRELYQRAERIIRGIGNQAAPGRANGNLTHRPDRLPRGLVLSTGESLPVGHSINARLVPVALDRSQINLRALTWMQDHRDRLPHAMRGFVEFILRHLSKLRETLPARRDALRAAFQRDEGHMRQGDGLAHVFLGIEVLSVYAEECGAATAVEARVLREKSRDELMALGGNRALVFASADPAERFMDTMAALVAQGCVQDVEGLAPAKAPVTAEIVGYRTSSSVLAIPDKAYKAVARHLGTAGERWAPAPVQLHRALVRNGHVLPGRDGRVISQHRIRGRRHRLLDIPLASLINRRSHPPKAASIDPAFQTPFAQPSQPSLRSDARTDPDGGTRPATGQIAANDNLRGQRS